MLSQFEPLGVKTAFLVDGGTAITVTRRNFPQQLLHYHRAGHVAVTSPQTQRGYTAFVSQKSPASLAPAASRLAPAASRLAQPFFTTLDSIVMDLSSQTDQTPDGRAVSQKHSDDYIHDWKWLESKILDHEQAVTKGEQLMDAAAPP